MAQRLGRADHFAKACKSWPEGAANLCQPGSPPRLLAKWYPGPRNAVGTAQAEKRRQYRLAVAGLVQGPVLKRLAKCREQRYQKAGELLDEVKRIGRFTGVNV
jgi:hypothetical protein